MASHPGIVRTVTWNLFHGRDHPPDPALFTWRSRLLRLTERNATHVQVNRSLRGEFVSVLEAVPWHLALLQEAPPRWLDALRQGCGADGALSLTSRNGGMGRLRALAADLNPDLIASAEGGSNMVLVRAPGVVEETTSVELAAEPERRTMLLARIRLGGARVAVACMHLSVPPTGQGPAEVRRAAQRAVAFAGDAPLVFGGDLNLRPRRHPDVFDELERQHGLAPPTDPGAIDHLLGRGLSVADPPRALPDSARELPAEAGRVMRLSDHAPVAAGFKMR